MANYPLRSIVAQSIYVLHLDNGYIPMSKSKDSNTYAKVLAILSRNPTPSDLDISYWQMADEILFFFRGLKDSAEYASIVSRTDGTEFQSCFDICNNEEITATSFPFAVLMPHLYGKLKPKQPKVLNPNETKAKIIQPGEFMGTINTPDRFFVKLVYVGRADASKGTLFKVLDRNGNIGYFHDRAERFESHIVLGDCFHIHATPSRHTPSANGEKHTIFRNVEFIVGTVVKGKLDGITVADDESAGKKFSTNLTF